MTDHDRAVAWLDTHPEVVEARVAANSILIANSHAMCVRAGIGNPLGQTVRMLADDLEKETRAALVAFLTSPLPCAFCPETHLLIDRLEADACPGTIEASK